jgi:ATP-binding cassette subfamily C protein CydC
VLRSFLALYRRHPSTLVGGILLAILSLLATIALLSLAGWLLAAAALAGLSGSAATFNYLLPAAAIRLLALLRTLGRYGERLITHEATLRLLTELRVTTFSRLLPLSPAGIQNYQQGELLNRLVADVDTLDHLYLRLLTPLLAAWSIILTVTLLLWHLDHRLALTLGGVLLGIVLLLPPLFYWAGRATGRALAQWQGQARYLLVDWLQGQAELISCGASPHWRQRLESALQAWQRCQQRQAALQALAQALLLLLSGALLLLMLKLVAPLWTTGQPSGAIIALVAFLTLAVFEAITPVATAFQPLAQVISAAQRLQQLLSQRPVVQFASAGPPAEAPLLLSLTDVSFTYPGRWQPTLQEINLTIATGEKVALLGHSGCGKSTLLQLITAGWVASQGAITLNQRSLSDYSEATLRSMMTVITQRVTLLSATLADNLLLAAPHASQEQLAQVLQQVGLTHLLEEQGLALWLGDGGRALSGGEQRRLGVARALLRDAPLLLLDEPTEGLDPQSEQQIFQRLLTFAQDRALILITHRPQGLEQMDRIVLLEAGRVIEQGSPAKLLAARGRYYQWQQRWALAQDLQAVAG